MEDAQVLRGEEGRAKLRKATGNCTEVLIRRYPNGATQYFEEVLSERRLTRGTETSKYPEEEKEKSGQMNHFNFIEEIKSLFFHMLKKRVEKTNSDAES